MEHFSCDSDEKRRNAKTVFAQTFTCLRNRLEGLKTSNATSISFFSEMNRRALRNIITEPHSCEFNSKVNPEYSVTMQNQPILRVYMMKNSKRANSFSLSRYIKAMKLKTSIHIDPLCNTITKKRPLAEQALSSEEFYINPRPILL